MIKLKNTKTVAINDYLYEVEFPYVSKMQSHKDVIVKQHYKDIEEANGHGFLNTKYHHKGLLENLKKVFYQILHHHFDLSPPLKEFEINSYIQTKDKFASVWHNHIHASSLAATFYLEIPKEGGEIEFCDHRYGGNTILKPKLNKLYIFPSWMYHRPLPHYDEGITRICINLDYSCLERPKPKLFISDLNHKFKEDFYW